jgi:hypothetical protein
MLTKWRVGRHLPWVLAAEPRDCGASVFASLTRFHGHHLTLAEARRLVGADRDGTSLVGRRDGGRAIGLDPRSAHATREARGQILLPAIVHLKAREGHYLSAECRAAFAGDPLEGAPGAFAETVRRAHADTNADIDALGRHGLDGNAIVELANACARRTASGLYRLGYKVPGFFHRS